MLKNIIINFKKDFYYYKDKDKFNNKSLNFIIYSNLNYDGKSIYIFLNKDESKIKFDYLGMLTLEIENVSNDFFKEMENYKEVFITEIDKRKKKKPISYIGKIIK